MAGVWNIRSLLGYTWFFILVHTHTLLLRCLCTLTSTHIIHPHFQAYPPLYSINCCSFLVFLNHFHALEHGQRSEPQYGCFTYKHKQKTSCYLNMPDFFLVKYLCKEPLSSPSPSLFGSFCTQARGFGSLLTSELLQRITVESVVH